MQLAMANSGAFSIGRGSRPSCIFNFIRRRIRRACLKLRCVLRKRPRLKFLERRFQRFRQKGENEFGQFRQGSVNRPIRMVTFNVAMFSLAPAVSDYGKRRGSLSDWPRSILKQSPLHPVAAGERSSRTKMRVSINLPENEISMANSVVSSPIMLINDRSKVPARSPICFPYAWANITSEENLQSGGAKSIFDVLREVDADIIALQDVKAVEAKGMRPLSGLADALGMSYVFAESWAPEYGNAILSKWKIKRWRAQRIADEDDFRNVLRAVIELPGEAGELSVGCTQLDHLDETWRMRQVKAIVEKSCHVDDHIDVLAGGLNSLDDSDYSISRWMDIVKYYQDIGKPTPKVEVTRYLKANGYVDAKAFAGDCEPVVIIAKGQNVQGTCKYGTRVDYVHAAPESLYRFVPSTYSVVSSEGTSDHHIVKVDIVRVDNGGRKGQKRMIKSKKKTQTRSERTKLL
ncbi:hypothetical protein MLD38_036129 [Melastoma candidum]|uniref:Uncharacterized protein n=1 Tax=Melastoma candidum TaxID=119954 RepID=A0ACB9LJB4_9MYRT|nr:hypothetical protein MLD38_036129 [Melastoma candidum]